MRLYIDLSCFNRPFDDQGQERIRRETQAVLVLRRIIEGSDTLFGPGFFLLKMTSTPNPTAGMRLLFGRPIGAINRGER
jgi:hypothetical protein